jgi:hypothetical protein
MQQPVSYLRDVLCSWIVLYWSRSSTGKSANNFVRPVNNDVFTGFLPGNEFLHEGDIQLGDDTSF